MNELTEENELIYCSVCHMTASLCCERCDDDICEICCTEDESIVFCYECWKEREQELTDEEDLEE